MKYEIVLIDADNTLFDFARAEEYALEKTLTYYEVKYDREYHLHNFREINIAIWEEFEEGTITAAKLKTERFRRLFEMLGIELDPVEFGSKYLDFLSEGAFLIDDAVTVLEGLREDYKLVLLTNGLARVQRSRLERSPIKKYFQAVMISEEVGIAKPEPGIFAEALKTVNHQDKETVIMVGDSLSSDIKGGINYGIDTCWFNPAQRNPGKDLEPTYQINELTELLDIL